MTPGSAAERSRFLALAAARKEGEFIDRESALGRYRTIVNALPQDDGRVLNFFGVGGIGKSNLLKHLATVTEDHELYITHLDLQQAILRRPDSALPFLRSEYARKHAIRLPKFDIAYAVYWQRANPHIPISKTSLPFIDDSDILSDILGAAAGTPVFGGATGLLQLLTRFAARGQRWRHVREDPQLQLLDDLDLEALLASLPYFFARDLAEELAHRRKRTVLLIDAHEALCDDVATTGGIFERDLWLRDLAAQLAGALMVVCSRDKLRWAEADEFWADDRRLSFHQLEDFPFPYRAQFLHSRGLIDPDLVDTIAHASEGVPFYLGIAVDLFHRITECRTPAPSDFEGAATEMLRRLLSHVPTHEEDLLKLLSIPRAWSRPLGDALVRHFNIGFPSSRWARFENYSFVLPAPDGHYRLHELMRTAIRHQVDDEFATAVHGFLYGYYHGEYERSPSRPGLHRFPAFREAAFHGSRSHTVDIDWLTNAGDELLDEGMWGPMSEVTAEIRHGAHTVVPNPRLDALADYFDGRIARAIGRVPEARRRLESLNLALLPQVEGRVRLELAHAARETGDTAAAASIYEDLRAAKCADSSRVCAMAGVWTGDILLVQGKFRAARTILQHAVSLGDAGGASLAAAQATRLLGHVDRFLERRDRALAQYEEAEQRFLTLDNYCGLGEVATNKVETLAISDPAQALIAAEDALSVNERIGHRLEMGKCQTAMAQAWLVLNQPTRARLILQASLRTLESVGYRSGMARAILTKAFVRAQLGDVEGAGRHSFAAINEFVEIDVYPTLVMLAAALCARLDIPLPRRERAALKQARHSAELDGGFSRRLADVVDLLLGKVDP